MAYRIVKESLKYGDTQYRVETNNGLFGLRKYFNLWKTATTWEYNYGTCDAVYESFEDAERYVAGKTDCVLESEVVAIYV